MNVILGTMSFGEQLFNEDANLIVKKFLSSGYDRLDTAYVYNEGKSEEIIGSLLESYQRDKLRIDTKVNPRITGHLDSDAISMQLEGSLSRMHTDYVDTYYFHFPEKYMDLESVLYTINEYALDGKIRSFGLSNFPIDMLVEIHDICRMNDWILPTAYEGLYNPLSRNAEVLDNVLTEFQMSFLAYNPLAGGLLTDKYLQYEDDPVKGRFTYRANYKDRYWKKSFFSAVDLIRQTCKPYGISVTEAAFRWLANSSMLKETRGDAIIIGVSKYQHLINNLQYINSDILPKEILQCFENAWEICRDDAPQYYRFYGV